MPEGYKPDQEFARREAGDTLKLSRQQRLVDDLTVLLETLNPESFSPGWVSAKNDSIRARITNKDLFASWEEIIQRLDEKWQERWKSAAITTPEKRQRLVSQLQAALEEHKPEVFSPVWIKTVDLNLYKRLSYHITAGLFPDWQGIINQLDVTWQKCWRNRVVQELPTETGQQTETLQSNEEPTIQAKKVDSVVSGELLSLEHAVVVLQELLEKYNPSIFGPTWIAKIDKRLYEYIIKNARLPEGKVDWSIVVPRLGQNWQVRWEMRPTNESERQLQLVRRLEGVLEKQQPAQFNVNWITTHAHSTYLAIWRALKAKVFADWEQVIDSLDTKWKERWKPLLIPPTEQERREGTITRLQVLLEKHKPEVFSPSWIAQNDSVLYERFKTAFEKKAFTSWGEAIQQLDSTWQERWRISPKSFQARERKEKRTAIVGELAQALQDLNPLRFNPELIGADFRPLQKRIYISFQEGLFAGWQDLIGKLDTQWQERWDTKWHLIPDSEKKRRLNKKLIELLEHKQPGHFSPFWIEENDPVLYRTIRFSLKEKLLVNWDDFIHTLSSPWPERWRLKEVDNNLGAEAKLEACFTQLKEFLERENPKRFNKWWVEKQNKALYGRIYHAQKRGAFTWADVISKLDTTWQERWQDGPVIKTEQERKDQILTQLNKFLTEKQPSNFSPFWIQENNRTLYENILLAFSKNIFKDWKDLLSQLPEEWQERWGKKPKSIKKKKDVEVMIQIEAPDDTYENIPEVDAALAAYGDSLYLLLMASNTREKEVRDAICRDLALLAQKRNVAAKDKLVELLYPLAQEWIDHYAQFAVYVHDFDTVRKAMTTCIDNYQAEGNTSFIGYLFGTLKIKAQYLKRQIAQSLDAPLGYDEEDRTLYDIVSAEEAEEDELEAA